LGKAWSNKYQTYWRSKHDEDQNHWPDLPYNWCLEFASWVLNRVGIHTKQLWVDYDNEYRNLPLEGVIDKLREFKIYHDPKDTTYAQLGQKIRPGNFLWIRSWKNFKKLGYHDNQHYNPNQDSGHAAFFIRWCNPDDYREVSFDPNKKINYFITIAGNEGYSTSKKVCFDTRRYVEAVYSVYDGEPPATITPSWAWVSKTICDETEKRYGTGAWNDGFAST
jgi:hypothetical protein